MQLLLSSGGNSSLSKGKLQTLNKLIKDLFTGIDEVIFISYAQKNRKEYTKRIREKWWPLKNVKLTGIEEYENPIDAIAEAKGIYIGGGNSFLLTHGLHENKLIDVLNEIVNLDIPYMGVSAGTNVACPTMMTTNDMAIIMPQSFQTINLVNFQINAHYHDGSIWLKEEEKFIKHNGETRAQRIKEFHQDSDVPVIGLFEGSLIRWRGIKGELMIGGGVIFHPGEKPFLVKRGTMINNKLEIC